jgi:hypothetical protein
MIDESKIVSIEPLRPGIYHFLFHSIKKQYVGQSFDIYGRIDHHMLSGKSVRLIEDRWADRKNISLFIYDTPQFPEKDGPDKREREKLEKEMLILVKEKYKEYDFLNKNLPWKEGIK